MRHMFRILLVAVLLTGILAAPVFAEEAATEETTVKTITLKKQKFTPKTSTAKKKAKEITIGESIVKMPAKGMGYLKFKAEKKGTYKFTFSDLVKKKGDQKGYINFQTAKSGKKSELVRNKVKTMGGSSYAVWIATKDLKSNSHPKIEWPRKSRTAKLKLKKGQEVYVFFSFEVKDTVTVKVAKA